MEAKYVQCDDFPRTPNFWDPAGPKVFKQFYF